MFTVLANAYLLNIAARAADVFWVVLLYSVLPTDEVAAFALASAVAAFFAMALDGGVNQTLLRAFSNGTLGFNAGARIALQIRATLFACVAVGGGLWFMSGRPIDEAVTTIAAACGVQVWTLIEQFCWQWMRANDQQTKANALSAVEPMLKVVVTIALTQLPGPVTALQFFVAQNIYHIVIAGLCVHACVGAGSGRRGIPEPICGGLLEVLRPSLWFAGIGLITVAQNRLDWLLVAHFSTPESTANYSMANRAYELMLMLIGTGATTLFPILCRNRGEPENQSPNMLMLRRLILSSGVLAGGVAAIALPDVAALLWGAKYVGAQDLFATLMPLAALATLTQLLYYDAVVARSEVKILWIAIASTIGQLLVNLVALPILGVQGAVLGMLTMIVLNNAAYLFQTIRQPIADRRGLVQMTVYAFASTVLWVLIALAPGEAWARLIACITVWAFTTWTWLLPEHDRQVLRARLGVRGLASAQRGASQ